MRRTFRPQTTGVAWQRQLRDEYADEGAPPGLSLELRHARVRRISRKQAAQVILKYEWLGTMASTNNHYGLFFGPYCAGAVCFSVGGGTAGVNAHKEWGLQREQFAVLARGANTHWSPPGANSKLVAWACKLLAQDTEAALVIAYADTDAGEIGTIYQACNWVCVGRGSSTEQFIAPNGRVFDQKLPYNLRVRDGRRYPRSWYVKQLLNRGWRTQQSNPKHRYVFVLDKSLRELVGLVESKREAYPKRVPA